MQEEQVLVFDLGTSAFRTGVAIDSNFMMQGKYTDVVKQNLENDDVTQHDVVYPVQRSTIVNWPIAEQIFSNAFASLVSQETAVAMSEPILAPHAHREQLAQVMFETYQVPFLQIWPAPIMSLMGYGRSTGLVVESGDGTTQILPVIECRPLVHAMSRLNVAGLDISNLVEQYAKEKGYQLPQVNTREVARLAKESICETAIDLEQAMQLDSAIVERSFTLPDGTLLKLGHERFLAAEAMFQPHLLGLDILSIDETMHECVQKCDIDNRKDLYYGIVLFGGNTRMQNFKTRLQMEMKKHLAKTSIKPNIIQPDATYSTWYGGSYMANLSTFRMHFVSKQSYDESGPQIMTRNSLF